MDLGSLSRGNKPKRTRKRVGRGHSTGQGKTSGRGHKGQKARSGYSRRIGFEGGQNPLHRRLPRRGFNHAGRYPTAPINLDVIDQAFEEGAEVTAEAIVDRGLVHRARGGVKVLARGELTKKLTLRVQAASKTAKSKIESAGGTLEIVPVSGKAAAEEA